ncbi:MAG TPA: GNAT family N-acetyltransferase [Ktedonobacteraceae bacterium]|jgi:ribosomal-protein-alanine N-acetyltransferase|nr:GNAT family N-acetyltransferase [Ktedonobacteraceae bacterium]
MGALFAFEEFPYLETRRLRLREIVEHDADAVFRIFSDPEVMHYYDIEAFTELRQAQQLIARYSYRFEQRQRFRWGIALKETDELIGTGGFVLWERRQRYAELGYDLARKYWRQGLMSEAAQAMVYFGFAHMDLHRIEAQVMPENIASIQLLRKVGFREEGTLRERGFWKDAFHDLTLFSILKQDTL